MPASKPNNISEHSELRWKVLRTEGSGSRLARLMPCEHPLAVELTGGGRSLQPASHPSGEKSLKHASSMQAAWPYIALEAIVVVS